MAEELLTDIQCSSGSRSFAKEIESLEDEELSGQPSEVDNAQLRAIIEADPLITTQEVVKELNVVHASHLAFEVNWKGEKDQ